MKSRRILFSAYLSNMFEFYDYTIFAALSPILSRVFFSGVSWCNQAYLVSFAFCLSLIVRPLGSILFGLIGDKKSRLLSLKISVLLMSISSFTIAFLPSHEMIGNAAVWIILFARVLQGISAGGEYNGAAIFSIDSDKSRSFLISGFLTSSAIMGLVLASFVSLFILNSGLPEYVFRIAIATGGMIGLASFFLRRIDDLKTSRNPAVPTVKFTKSILPFLTVFFIGGQTSSLSYFALVNLKQAFMGLKFTSPLIVNLLIMTLLLIASLSSILFGWLAQRTIRARLMKIGVSGVIIFTPIAFLLMSFSTMSMLCLGSLIFALSLGCHGSIQHAYFQEFIKDKYKQTFISVAFSLGTGILGSLTIFVSSSLTLTFGNLCFLWFSLISGLSYFLMIKLEESNEILLLNEQQPRHERLAA